MNLTEKPTVPMMLETKHPLRFAIRGVKDKIADLKKFVGEQEFDSGLKTFIDSELDKIKTNAAEIHLHDTEQPDGGFDLHLSIRPVVLGTHAAAVHKRKLT